MNGGEQIRAAGMVSVRGGFFRADLLVLGACLFVIGGCASSARIVKSDIRPKDGVAGAISRAFSFAKETGKSLTKKKSTPTDKLTTFAPLPNNANEPRVRRFIRHYAYEQRETMRKYLARAERYLPMVKEICREQGLPEDISYLFLLESGANPEARSPANALGMWQFMPATARSYGLTVDSHVDERLDPRKSTKAAMLYLKDLYGMFGCWRLALSAYNSGENKLNRVLCAEDADEYDEICSSRKLKRETREFFPRFQAIALIAKNPRKYGFAPTKRDQERAEFVYTTVRGSYSLEDLAWAIAVPHKVLEDLNPSLFRGITPPSGPYRLRVPTNKRTLLGRKLKEIPRHKGSRHIVHVVHKGDSVARILRRYSISRSQLVSLNPDVNLRKVLRRGERLLVPVHKKARTKKSRRREQLSLLR